MTQLTPEGRLELTWTNKHRRLLAHDDSSYEWVDPSDYRVAEVRLLHDVTTIGEAQPDSRRVEDNLLIRGDALSALTSLIELPEYARVYAGKVRLVYIDPPFNTGQTFKDYDDGLQHSVWLTMLRDRLEQIRALLAPNGSVWLHLDDVEVHRARCVLDEVFGADKFVATIIWQKRTSRDNRTAFSSAHDYLLVYAPEGPQRWKEDRNLVPDEGGFRNPDDDPRGPWRSVPMSAQAGHATEAQFYSITTPSGAVHDPPRGRAWTYTRPRFEELLAEGRVYWPRDGDGRPRLKRYASEVEGLVPFTIWSASEVGENLDAKRHIMSMFPEFEPFETPKPEALIERVIHIATQPGEIVLDCFLGSGTTAAVAQKMARRWVGIEWEPSTLANFAVPRLTKVVSGEDPGGVTDTVGWRGGGGFRVIDVAPSMFEASHGRVFLANWAVNGSLAEATAAQLGFEYEVRQPFCGRKGRSRLAVVDGLVNEDVVQVLIGVLDESERLVVCGTSIDPAARSVLRELRPGSTLRKIPSSILKEYRLRRRSHLRDLLDWDDAVAKLSMSEGEGAAS
jgi:adenine-specific DNA-methyltransferase